jgi:hypothetical protein
MSLNRKSEKKNIYHGNIDRYSNNPDGWRHRSYNESYPLQGRTYNEESNMPFYRRQNGYHSQYGTEEDESGSMTSKILAALSKFAADRKEKADAKKLPQSQSSNITYSSSVTEGDYEEATVILPEKSSADNERTE